MMMTVFRQAGRTSRLDHLAALELATSKEDIDLITWAFLNEKPALVGLDGQACIIKPQENGDDGMSFASLFDTALTPREYRRMKAHNVQSREAIGDVLYRVTLIAEFTQHPRATCLIRARDEIDFRQKLRRLLEDDAFKKQLTEALVEQIFTQDETSIVTPGALKLDDPAPKDSPEYEFVTPDGD
jgi:hypothetical protein